MYSKKTNNPKETIKKYITSGTKLMSGGFGLCGIPENSINIIKDLEISNLTVISNNIGNSGRGLVYLLKRKLKLNLFLKERLLKELGPQVQA